MERVDIVGPGFAVRWRWPSPKSSSNRSLLGPMRTAMYDTGQIQDEDTVSAIELERFYRRLLRLESATEPTEVIPDLLMCAAAITRATFVFVEVFATGATPGFQQVHVTEPTAADSVAEQLAPSVIERSLAERRMIAVGGQQDEHGVEASVLCMPLGRLPVGLLYVRAPTPLSRFDRDRLELLAHRISRVAHRLGQPAAPKARSLKEDIVDLQNRRTLSAMQSNDGNITGAARELQVGRAFVHRVLRRLSRGVSGRSKLRR